MNNPSQIVKAKTWKAMDKDQRIAWLKKHWSKKYLIER